MASRRKVIAVLRVIALPLIAVTASLVAWKLGYFDLDRRREVARIVEAMRQLPGVEVVYLAAYALVVVLCLPAVVMTVIGGAFFGPIFGPVFAWGGLLLGTLLSHTLAARVARKPLRRMFGEHKLLHQLGTGVGFTGLFRMRVLPVAPFGVFSYVAGMAGVPILLLLLASAVAVIPSVIAYGYVGSELMRGFASDPTATGRALRVAGYVTLGMLALSALPSIIKKLRG